MTRVPAIGKASLLACICAFTILPGSAGADRHATFKAAMAEELGGLADMQIKPPCATVPTCINEPGLGDGAETTALPIAAKALGRADAPRANGSKAQFRVGDRIDANRLHVVTRPGLYGVGRPPAGSSYGVVSGRLIRFYPETMQVLSVIRDVDEILD